MPQSSQWTGKASVKGSTEAVQMALLTFSLVGLQFTWGIEMTYCTPYLLQLGLTKSKTSMVWIAGPLSGLIMQPIVGVIADNSTSRWGRRRPFMVVGSFAVGACLLMLGWTAEVVGFFTSSPDSKGFWTLALAIMSIYVVDFAINAVQASCRSLIVDTLPISKQQTGSAWASRMVAVGHLVGYGFGTLDLQVLLGPVFGDTQFKKLTVIAALVLLFAVGVTSWAVEERVLLASSDSENARVNPTAMLSKLFRTAFHLPPRIQAICWVQFWAWIGWFPFLFYSPTWVGEIYFRYSAPPGTSPSETDHLGEMGRIASLSLVVFSIITFLGSLLFPMLIRSPTEAGKPAFTPRPHPLLAPYMETLSKIQPDLLMAWLCSHLIFAAAMLMAPFVQSIHAATMLVGASGLPWALACWAPFAFMGIEINKLSSSLPSSRNHTPAPKIELSTPTSGTPQPIPPVSKFDDEKPTAGPGNAESSGEMAGIYLGMLNVFSTLPQFVGTFISMVVFSLLEPGKEVEESTKDVTDAADAGAAGGEGLAKSQLHKATAQTEGVNAIAICLFIGGLSSLVAAWATVKLRAVK